MDKELITHLNYLLCTKIERVTAVSGGDISKAYLLESETEKFFCKINGQGKALKMFMAEKKGLEELLKTNTLSAPRPFHIEPYNEGAFFLMEYIESKSPDLEEMSVFGRQLAQLHQSSNKQPFGWEEDNFIGSLFQSNKTHQDWASFYVRERLLPQIQLAFDKGLLNRTDTPIEEKMVAVCNNLFPKVNPSLLHGDLWSGNFLISNNGVPFFIDPAVYYGHHEVDIAMTKLFGGFGDSFYDAYREIIRPEPEEDKRMEIYQLYYLLVHLNLFGPSYASSVKRIMSTYF